MARIARLRDKAICMRSFLMRLTLANCRGGVTFSRVSGSLWKGWVEAGTDDQYPEACL